MSKAANKSIAETTATMILVELWPYVTPPGPKVRERMVQLIEAALGNYDEAPLPHRCYEHDFKCHPADRSEPAP